MYGTSPIVESPPCLATYLGAGGASGSIAKRTLRTYEKVVL